MNQQRSRRTLVAIGIGAAALLAGPFVWKAWNSGHELADKQLAFEQRSPRAVGDLLGCLVKRHPGGLSLDISSENHFVDAGRGLVVRIEPHGDYRTLKAWNAAGKLAPDETAQLEACAR